jgi:hypothetical protein
MITAALMPPPFGVGEIRSFCLISWMIGHFDRHNGIDRCVAFAGLLFFVQDEQWTVGQDWAEDG